MPLSGVPEGMPIGRSLAWVDGSSILRELVWGVARRRRDAAWLVYYGVEREGSVAGTPDPGDLFVLNRRTKEKRRLALPGYQRGGRLSPDGRWLAFPSAQKDTWEVHVRPFPSFDADCRLSADGGDEPAWSVDGKELCFRRGPDMMTVKVPAPGAAGGWPPAQVLFTGGFARDHFGDQSHDVTRDGRFLMMRPASISQIPVQVGFDWMAEVRARLAAGR
jgi:hypothetical protein